MAAATTQTAPGVPTPSPNTAALPQYTQVEESKHELDWADLVTLDLSKFDTVEGRNQLAKQLRDAVHRVGFFYITNFGLTQHQIDQQFAIGRDLFSLPMTEKLKYRANLESGDYNGYRPLGAGELFPGMRDNVEMYNVYKFIPALERTQPEVINKYRAEVERFQRHIAQVVVPMLLTLVGMVLELPNPASLIDGHRYEDVSGCHLRYINYTARTPEENEKYQGLYSKGHTDFGSLTLLFRQPIAALQILHPNGTWKWVKPYPDSITVNIADVLQFWSNGYLKSSIHRVVSPPADQAHLDRLGLLYFLRPAHDLTLKALDSPLLRREGLAGVPGQADEVKAGDWVSARVKGNFDRAPKGGVKEKEVIGGLKAKYYD